MINIFNNKEAFLNEKPKYGFIVVILLIVVFLLIILYMCKTDIYDNYQTKGYISCNDSCVVITTIPSNLSYEKIDLNNKSLDYEIVNSELILDEVNYETYYKITISSSYVGQNNEIVDLNFYCNKQRIITKIKNNMF